MSDTEEPQKYRKYLNSDHGYSEEELSDLRLLGAPKPDSVSWGQWIGPRDHSHRHKQLAYMAATGATGNQIAAELGYTPGRVSIILSDPKMKAEIAKIQESFWGANAKKRFDNLMPKALNVIEEILDSAAAKDTTKLDAAKFTVERTMGKAQQHVSVHTSLLAEVIHRLDANPNAIDVSAIQSTENPQLDAEKKELDSFVKGFVQSSIVGVRGTESEEDLEEV